MGARESLMPTLRRAEPADLPFPRYVRKRASRQRWKGPNYLIAQHWRNDLLMVVEQIRLSVKANVPLSPAFATAAQDYLAANRGISAQRVTRLTKLAGLTILVFLATLGALGELQEKGSEALPDLIAPALLGLWLIVVAARQGHKPVAVFAALQAHIESGHTLSEAMARLPRFFPRNLVALTAMGEKTGTLTSVFANFSGETLKRITAGQELRRMLAYFGAGIFIQCSIIFFLMIKVVPVFFEILSEMEVQGTNQVPVKGVLIPVPPAELVVALTDFAVYQGSVILTILAWSYTLWLWIRPHFQRRNWGSRRLSTVLLAVPGIRGMMARENLGTAAFMLQQMLRAGVPLEQVLDAVAHADLHFVYRRWFARVRKRVLNGNTLREACSGIRLTAPVPRSFVHMIGLGESHGPLEDSLGYLSERYHAQVEHRRRLLVAGVLPLGVLIMGYIALSMTATMFQFLTLLAEALIP